MIDFYCWSSGNNRKIFMMLEETGLAYTQHVVNLRKKEQLAPEFLAINPNNKVPAIVDSDGPGGQPITVFESGAILIYLAEKTGQFRPDDERSWFDVLQWLMFQMGAPGALFTEAHYFYTRALSGEPDMAYPRERYVKEAHRLLGVINSRLGKSEYIAGDTYSIADMGLMPHCCSIDRFGADLEPYPNIARWVALVGERPATKRVDDIISKIRIDAGTA